MSNSYLRSLLLTLYQLAWPPSMASKPGLQPGLLLTKANTHPPLTIYIPATPSLQTYQVMHV